MLRTYHKPLVALLPGLALALIATLSSATVVAIEATGDERQRVTTPNFEQAMQFNREYLQQYVYDTAVTPRWIGKSDSFWYQFRTNAGTKYWRVNAKLAVKEPLFDCVSLGAKLGEQIKRPVDSNQLPISRAEVNDEGTKLKFVAADLQFEYDFLTEELKNQGKAPAPPPTLPQGRGGEISREEFEKRREEFLKQREEEDKKQQDDQKQDQQQEKNDGEQQKRDVQGDGQNQDRANRGAAFLNNLRSNDYRNFSPDRSMYVFAKNHNLYLVEVKPEDIIKPDPAKSDESKKADEKSDAAKKDETKTEAKTDETKTDEKKDETKTEGNAGEVVKDAEKKVTETKIAEESDKATSAETETGEERKEGDASAETKKPEPQDEGRGNRPNDTTKAEEEKPIPRTSPKADERAIQLTTDGVENYSFAGRGGFGGRRGGEQTNAEPPKTPPDRKTRANVVWSKDSKAFYVTRSDGRNVANLWVINSLATPRPTLETYPYPLPGEEGVRKTELYVMPVSTKKLTRVAPKWKDESYENLHWGKTGDDLRFFRRDRLVRNVEFCTLNPSTGECKCMIEEGFENANLTSTTVRYLEDTNEMIWWSERSGWGHFYLYERDGKLKNAITSGPYRAGRIVEVDEKNRTLYFLGNGREPNENVYYEHLYAVRFDGSGLTLLDPGDASHRSILSPSRQFLVDNWSRVDQAPKATLRDASGKEIMLLEEADLSRLYEAGWKLPETFVVKAADGVTDLYGNLWKPFDFDPKKKYPIIANVYPGPQTEGVSHTFATSGGTMQLAQLGFIVIQVGHRGGIPTRSKAYGSYGYFNLRDYGLADKKFAIEQLAARNPWIDINRVGLYGHSGGGFMTAAAMLQKPYNDFFKVGIATSGNHDNNIYGNYWAERYHGLKEVAVTDEKSKSGTRGGRDASTATQQVRRGASDNPDAWDVIQTEEEQWITEQEAWEELNSLLNPEWTPPPSMSGQFGGPAPASGFDDPQDATVKQDEKSKTDEHKDDAAKSDEKKADEKKAVDKKAEEKKTKFEIAVPTNQELAGNLKGKLLLIHGELDNNVHPANTLRLVDALIKANKRFDMMYLPGKRHGYADYQPYVTQRMWEYFAENLMGEDLQGADLYER